MNLIISLIFLITLTAMQNCAARSETRTTQQPQNNNSNNNSNNGSRNNANTHPEVRPIIQEQQPTQQEVVVKKPKIIKKIDKSLSKEEQEEVNKKMLAIIEKDDVIAFQQIVEDGADVNKALLWSTNLEILKIALEYGADINNIGQIGTTFTDVMEKLYNEENEKKQKAYADKAIFFIENLKNDGYDLNELKAPSNRVKTKTLIIYLFNTPHYSSKEVERVIKFLVESGIDINSKDMNGTTPLMAAVKNVEADYDYNDKAPDIVEYLLQKGANPDSGLAIGIEKGYPGIVEYFKKLVDKAKNQN